MKKNEVKINTIFYQNIKKYIKIYFKLILKPLVFLIGFIMNIIQNYYFLNNKSR
jgi:hypothetical protein